MGRTHQERDETHDKEKDKERVRATGIDDGVDRARGTKLAEEVQHRDDGHTQRAHLQAEHFRLTEVLDRVDTDGPGETTEKDEEDGGIGHHLARGGFHRGTVGVVEAQVEGQVERGNGLDGQTAHDGKLTTEQVDDEKGSGQRRKELDDTKDARGEQFGLLALNADKAKDLGCKDGHGAV